MNAKKTFLFLFFALAALTLGACGAQPPTNWPSLAADAEKVYLANGPFVYALNLSDGKEAWRYPAEADGGRQFFASPVLTPDGQLLVGSVGTKRDLSSVNPVTGRDNWTTPFTKARGAWVASPLVFNELIYAPNADGFLYVLKLDGTFVESVELGGALWSAPVTDGTFIYVASLDHHLHIIDPSNLQSKKEIDLGGAIPGGLTVGADGIYAGTFASNLERVTSAGDHSTLATAADWIWGAPALDGETLYYADIEGNVYSLNLVDGKQNWSGVKPDDAIVASPLVVGEQIFIVTEAGLVVALNREGKEDWRRDVKMKLYTQPFAAGDLILVAPYFSKDNVLLIAFDAEGKQAWTFAPEK